MSCDKMIEPFEAHNNPFRPPKEIMMWIDTIYEYDDAIYSIWPAHVLMSGKIEYYISEDDRDELNINYNKGYVL